MIMKITESESDFEWDSFLCIEVDVYFGNIASSLIEIRKPELVTSVELAFEKEFYRLLSEQRFDKDLFMTGVEPLSMEASDGFPAYESFELRAYLSTAFTSSEGDRFFFFYQDEKTADALVSMVLKVARSLFSDLGVEQIKAECSGMGDG